MIEWLSEHWLEIAGTFLALVYLYLSVRENIWLWATGFLSSFFYMIVFFDEHLYADMGLQVYYLVISIYGWLTWKWGRQKTGRKKMPIRKMNFRTGTILLLTGGVVYVVVLMILLKIPPLIDIPASELPIWDAFTTTGGIIATWMLAQKFIEQWLIWIVVDLVSSGMYFYKGLEVTVLLYLIYTVVAVIGYLEWNKNMKIRDSNIKT